jgi:siroheme synthase (precorrin-2 oxidase/ferrochelatase)
VGCGSADYFRLNRFKYFIALGTKLDVVSHSSQPSFPNSARNARTSIGIGPTFSPAFARISDATRANTSRLGGSR